MVIKTLLSFFLLLGCAYHVGDSRTPEKTLRVFVPVFENRTGKVVDLNSLTSVMREGLESVHGVEVVNNSEQADAIVLGKVTGLERTWGQTFFKGDAVSEAKGGLKKDALSAESARLTLSVEIEKLTPRGDRLWRQGFSEFDYYQLTDRLELAQGSAAAPQIHAARETLLVKKLAERIFRRVRAQLVDDF